MKKRISVAGSTSASRLLGATVSGSRAARPLVPSSVHCHPPTFSLIHSLITNSSLPFLLFFIFFFR
jgi:hypothetical protein